MGVGEGGEALSSPSSPSSVSLLPAVRHLTLVRCRESDPERACSVKRQMSCVMLTSCVTRHSGVMRRTSSNKNSHHKNRLSLPHRRHSLIQYQEPVL